MNIISDILSEVVSLNFQSSFFKNNESSIAMRQNREKTTIGIGYLNSTSVGETMTMNLPAMLQIPKAVPQIKVGNRNGVAT